MKTWKENFNLCSHLDKPRLCQYNVTMSNQFVKDGSLLFSVSQLNVKKLGGETELPEQKKNPLNISVNPDTVMGPKSQTADGWSK